MDPGCRAAVVEHAPPTSQTLLLLLLQKCRRAGGARFAGEAKQGRRWENIQPHNRTTRRTIMTRSRPSQLESSSRFSSDRSGNTTVHPLGRGPLHSLSSSRLPSPSTTLRSSMHPLLRSNSKTIRSSTSGGISSSPWPPPPTGGKRVGDFGQAREERPL